MPRNGTAWLLALLAVALATSCGRTDGPVAPENAASKERTGRAERSGVATRFVGSEWELTRLNDRRPLRGTNITLEVDREEGRIGVGGTATCNYYGARNVTMKNGVFETSGSDMTEIGCPDDELGQETAYVDALDEAAGYRLRGDTLQILDSEGTVTIVFERESLARSDPANLVGTTWLLRTVDGEPLPDAFPATVSFDSDKKVSGYDGCRHFTGRYFANEKDLTVPSYGYKADYDCMKPGAYGGKNPVPILENIPLEGNYTLEDGRLEIRDDAGAVSAYEALRQDANVEEPGAAWVLEQFVDGDRSTPVLDGTEITLRFDGGVLRRGGTMDGSAGCNTYSARYEYVDEFVSGTPEVVSTTKKSCSEEIMEQERRYLDRLEKDTYWYTVNLQGELELTTEDNERRMVFAAPER